MRKNTKEEAEVWSKLAPKRKPKKIREKDIQRSILKWLESEGVLHWRQNSGFIPVGDRRITLGKNGLPDIVIILPPNGKVIGMEVKTPTGKLRDSQIAFAQKLQQAGGEYVVVRSLEDAQKALAAVRRNLNLVINE